jgi:small subunit ribosomal protein S2
MPTIPTLKDMLKAGVHFGHRVSRWHPKMAPYIFGKRSGVHVIDLEKTQVQLKEALDFVENLVARGGNILFVGTKTQYQDLVQNHADRVKAPYVNTRWLGGMFTNFSEIQKLIKQYIDLKDKREKGELRKYTKLEQLMIWMRRSVVFLRSRSFQKRFLFLMFVMKRLLFKRLANAA